MPSKLVRDHIVEEFIVSDNPEEIADVLEVLQALAAEVGHTWPEIEALADKKRSARGAFHDRLVLDT